MSEEDESATGAASGDVIRRAVPHDGERGLDVLVVGTEVVHIPGRLVRPEASSVLAQVECVEPCAESRPEAGEMALEEVVRPAVDVQDVDPVRDVGEEELAQLLERRHPVADERGHDVALVVRFERQGPLLEPLAEDVVRPASRSRHAATLPCASSRTPDGPALRADHPVVDYCW
jgi:hypothetical protein